MSYIILSKLVSIAVLDYRVYHDHVYSSPWAHLGLLASLTPCWHILHMRWRVTPPLCRVGIWANAGKESCRDRQWPLVHCLYTPVRCLTTAVWVLRFDPRSTVDLETVSIVRPPHGLDKAMRRHCQQQRQANP